MKSERRSATNILQERFHLLDKITNLFSISFAATLNIFLSRVGFELRDFYLCRYIFFYILQDPNLHEGKIQIFFRAYRIFQGSLTRFD